MTAPALDAAEAAWDAFAGWLDTADRSDLCAVANGADARAVVPREAREVGAAELRAGAAMELERWSRREPPAPHRRRISYTPLA